MKTAPTLSVLDLGQLRNVTLDDETLMREVINDLVSDASQQIEELQRAVGRADMGECVRVAHGAQGACGNVGAASMAALFCSVAHHAEAGDFTQCGSFVEDLSVELEKLRAEANSI